jgi:hypothetical protein
MGGGFTLVRPPAPRSRTSWYRSRKEAVAIVAAASIVAVVVRWSCGCAALSVRLQPPGVAERGVRDGDCVPHCADSGGGAGRGLLLLALSLRKSEACRCAGSTFSRCAMERLRSLAGLAADGAGMPGASRALWTCRLLRGMSGLSALTCMPFFKTWK